MVSPTYEYDCKVSRILTLEVKKLIEYIIRTEKNDRQQGINAIAGKCLTQR